MGKNSSPPGKLVSPLRNHTQSTSDATRKRKAAEDTEAVDDIIRVTRRKNLGPDGHRVLKERLRLLEALDCANISTLTDDLGYRVHEQKPPVFCGRRRMMVEGKLDGVSVLISQRNSQIRFLDKERNECRFTCSFDPKSPQQGTFDRSLFAGMLMLICNLQCHTKSSDMVLLSFSGLLAERTH